MSFSVADAVLKEDYLPSVMFNLEAARRVLAEDYDTMRPLPKTTRRQRMRRRVRALGIRLWETWDVLWHGLPDAW